MDRLVVRALSAACRAMWGFAPSVLSALVDRMGWRAALVWFATNMPRYQLSLLMLGPLRFHLSAMIISMRNGCGYCAHGHGYALELIYLRDRDRLFPLDATTTPDWFDLDSRSFAARMRDVLQDAGMHAEALWADRTCELVDGLVLGTAAPADRDEQRVAHLARMIGTMNRIAVDAGVAPEQAQNPVNKDAEVKRRHEALRTR